MSECSHPFMRYTGTIPCTGPRKCDRCGYVCPTTRMSAPDYVLPSIPPEYSRQLAARRAAYRKG